MITGKWISKELNRCVCSDWDHLSKAADKRHIESLEKDLSLNKLNADVDKLTHHESLGSCSALPDMIKSLDR